MRKLEKALPTFLYVILAIVVTYFYYIHLKHSINFPYNDEFRTIATVIIDYANADGFWGKMNVLLVNENESLQLFLKLTNIITYEIFGTIRYDILGYIGQVSLLGFPLVVYLLNKKSDTLWFDLGLTILIVFNLQYYVLSFRHDTSFYYHVGLFGVLFSVYHWVKGNYKLMALFLLLGVFNNTSSVLVLPVFLIDYILSAKNIKKKYVVGGAIAFITVLAFFYTLNPYIFDLPEGIEVTTKAFVIILGNLVEFKYNYFSETPYLFYGSAYLIFILYTLYYYFFKYKNRSEIGKFYGLIVLYFFISIVAIALKRSSLYHHLNNLLDPRYKFFTFPLLLFILLLWNEMRALNKKVKWGLVIIFLLYNVYCAFVAKDYMRYLYRGAKLNSVALREGYDIMGPTHIDFAIPIFNKLDSMGIAPPANPEILELHQYLKNVKIDANTPKFEAELTKIRVLDLNYYQTIQRVIANSETKDCFVFLKSDDNVVLFTINFFLKNSKVGFIKSLDYTGDKFYSYMFLSVLNEGVYDLGLVSRAKDGSYSIKVYPEKTIIDQNVTNLKDKDAGPVSEGFPDEKF